MTKGAELEARVFAKCRNIKAPISIKEVADKLLLDKPVQVFYVDMPTDIGEYIRKTSANYYIMVNKGHPIGRQRFSATHGIAHLRLEHKEISVHPWDFKEGPEEDEADAFAAALLMPASDMYVLASHYHKNILGLLDRVQEYFQVSLSAAARRIVDLELFQGAILLKERDGYKNAFYYGTSEFDGVHYRNSYKRTLRSGKILHVVVAETYRHVVRWEIG